ncbi:MAG: M20/M25/M40 family metallo-hydrolase [Enterocloster asparagiformis]|nr:M20/M25/M40 family metallo-hydrolase [Enterocloster asparagiformis]
MALKQIDFDVKWNHFAAQNEERWIQEWLDLVRQPSVSTTGQGVEGCGRMIAEHMRRIGLEPEIYPVRPYPVIVARHGETPDRPTVLIYAHYDVVEPGDPALWKTPPFEPVIVDGKVFGRGAADNKSPLMAHLQAYEFWKSMGEELPVNLIFLFEGCEESGSRGLPEFLREHREELKADLVFFSDGPKNERNLPIIALGAKGNITIRLKLRTMNQDAHSRYAPVLPSAAWQIVELLSKLKTGDHVNVEGFYDGIVPPGQEEMDIYRSLPPVEREMEEIYGVKPICGADENYYIRLNTTPTFNIKRISSGDGRGVVTSMAEALIDIRLVEGQEPRDILEKVSSYVKFLGYHNVMVESDGGVFPSKTPVGNSYVPVISRVVREVYGDYVIYPCRPSTAPDYLWTKILEIPAIQVRWSDADSNNHAPNEHQSVAGYLKGVELTARVIREIGEMKGEKS